MRRPACVVRSIGAALWLLCASASAAGAAQAPPEPRLRIFLDCWECDTEFLRQNVLFIEYMRDRTDADLHVLVTTRGTGGGGTSWIVQFIGLGRLQTQDRTVTFTTPSSATSDDRRREFARRFRLALAGYAAETAVASDLDVTWRPPPAAASQAPAADPWRKWVFRVNGSGNGSGEQATKSLSYRGSFSASRVTPTHKVSASTSGSVSERRFTLSDGRRLVSRSDSWNVSSTFVRSLGPRLSTGVRVSGGHSSFDNRDRSLSLYPGIEFDFFPYEEFDRRRLTIWYEVGPNFYDYRELTVFDKLRETVPKQQMDVSLTLRQPWGSVGAYTSFSQHLNQFRQYNASLSGDADIRLFKGFSFTTYAYYSRIRDQIALPKAGASTEEVLLRLRQLETGYSYSISVGFGYTFGSIFNSVVNPRFGGPNPF